MRRMVSMGILTVPCSISVYARSARSAASATSAWGMPAFLMFPIKNGEDSQDKEHNTCEDAVFSQFFIGHVYAFGGGFFDLLHGDTVMSSFFMHKKDLLFN